MSPFIYTVTLSQEHIEQVQKSLANTPQPSKSADMPAYVHSLLLAAQGAAGSWSLPLANLAAEKAIGSFDKVDRAGQDKLLTAIVDAANAIPDEAQHHTWLGQRFEQLAFSCTTTEQAALISGVIEHLHEVHPHYRLSLSRAHAAAELFLHRQP